MTFTSPSFYVFLPAAYLLFLAIPVRWRPAFLVAASYVFYALQGAPYLLLIIGFVTIASYAGGFAIRAAETESRRTLLLWFFIAACSSAFIVIKVESLHSVLVVVGVSYYTLQAISYLADVYSGRSEVETSFVHYALHVAFFPKLLQGPIERAPSLLSQLHAEHEFRYDAARSAALLFARGLFRKVVIADRLAVYVDSVYGHVHAQTGTALLLATWAFAAQVYFDFAGYTDMARATGRLFGIELMENFNQPYLARSVADFWRRWHISFSSWLLDYIFKPLQFVWRRAGRSGTALALLVTFFASGLWHSFTSTFICWGLIHGVYLTFSTLYKPVQRRIYIRLDIANAWWLPAWQIFVTFNLVSFAWIFFRASSLGDALFVVRAIARPSVRGIAEFVHAGGVMGARDSVFMLTCLLILVVSAIYRPLADAIRRAYNGQARWLLYYITALVILVFGWFGRPAFIYGRF